MPDEIKAPILSYEDIRQRANTSLAHYHPSRALPVPIEEIIDLQLELFIVAIPGLQREFEIDAFMTSDCREIYVDEFVYTKRPRRYRFSLAHELGHIVLHQDLYQAAQFHSVDEWKQFIETFPKKEYHWFEYQANSFAGLFLAPREELEACTEEAVRMAVDRGIKNIGVSAWDYIADYVSDVFEVSRRVIEKRLKEDGIKTVEWLKGRGFL